jgi:cytidylate kinase
MPSNQPLLQNYNQESISSGQEFRLISENGKNSFSFLDLRKIAEKNEPKPQK